MGRGLRVPRIIVWRGVIHLFQVVRPRVCRPDHGEDVFPNPLRRRWPRGAPLRGAHVRLGEHVAHLGLPKPLSGTVPLRSSRSGPWCALRSNPLWPAAVSWPRPPVAALGAPGPRPAATSNLVCIARPVLRLPWCAHLWGVLSLPRVRVRGGEEPVRVGGDLRVQHSRFLLESRAVPVRGSMPLFLTVSALKVRERTDLALARPMHTRAPRAYFVDRFALRRVVVDADPLAFHAPFWVHAVPPHGHLLPLDDQTVSYGNVSLFWGDQTY